MVFGLPPQDRMSYPLVGGLKQLHVQTQGTKHVEWMCSIVFYYVVLMLCDAMCICTYIIILYYYIWTY